MAKDRIVNENPLSEEGKLIMSLPVACRCHECTMYKMEDNPEHGACPIVKLQASENATHCAYCGEEFPLDNVTADQVGEHIDKCPKHPIAALKKQIAELEYQHEADTLTIGVLADVVDVLWEDDSRCEKHGYGNVVAKAKDVVARAHGTALLDSDDRIIDLLSREKDPTFAQCIYFSMVFHGWLPDFENRRWVATCSFGSELSQPCEIIDGYDINSRDDTGDLATGVGTSVFDLAMRAWKKIQKEQS